MSGTQCFGRGTLVDRGTLVVIVALGGTTSIYKTGWFSTSNDYQERSNSPKVAHPIPLL